MFRLSIVTPEQIFFEADVKSLMIPGTEGYLGILTGHAPIITALKPGKITFSDASGKEFVVAVSAGFLEFSDNVATLLADAVENAGDIDLERAKQARARALDELATVKGSDDSRVKTIQIMATLDRAKNRIKIHQDTN